MELIAAATMVIKQMVIEQLDSRKCLEESSRVRLEPKYGPWLFEEVALLPGMPESSSVSQFREESVVESFEQSEEESPKESSRQSLCFAAMSYSFSGFEIVDHATRCAAERAELAVAQKLWAASWPCHCRSCYGAGWKAGHETDYWTGEPEGDVCRVCVGKRRCPRCKARSLQQQTGEICFQNQEQPGQICTLCGWTGNGVGDQIPLAPEWSCDCEWAQLVRSEREDLNSHGEIFDKLTGREWGFGIDGHGESEDENRGRPHCRIDSYRSSIAL